jgi:HEAT repeat protein
LEKESVHRAEITALISALTDGKNVYRMLQAAASLGNHGHAAVEPLMEVMTDPIKGKQWQAAIALQKIGRPALLPLIQALNEENRDVRSSAIWALAKIGDEGAVEPLIRVLSGDTHDFCRWMASAALIKINNHEGLKAVEAALLNEDAVVRGYIEDLAYGM